MPGLRTLITPASYSRLTSVANAKDDLGTTDSSLDSWLGKVIDRATGVITNYCGRNFGVEAQAEVFRFGWDPGVGPATQTAAPYGTPLNVHRKPLILSRSPVLVSPAPVVVENSTTLTEGIDYEIDYGAGLVFRLRSGIRSWWNVPQISVAFSSGWVLPEQASPNLPADVESICLALVRAAYYARGVNPSVQLELAENIGRTAYFDRGPQPIQLDEDTKAQLSDYCVRVW